MCDYSLTCVSNRLAVEGEELVVHRFHTGSRGLTAPAAVSARPDGLWARAKAAFARDRAPAVCIPPGAELSLTGIAPDVRRACGVGSAERVTFVQRSANAFEHRDAIRFANGKVLPLQWLEEGQRATVLTLAAEADGQEGERKPARCHVAD
jgi:hypothetical protein